MEYVNYSVSLLLLKSLRVFTINVLNVKTMAFVLFWGFFFPQEDNPGVPSLNWFTLISP